MNYYEDNIKNGSEERRLEGAKWLYLAQDTR
jgi:hypothetical protein